MARPPERQRHRYAEWCAALAAQSPAARRDTLRALCAAGTEAPQVVFLLQWRWALPPEVDRDRSGERIGRFTLCELLAEGGGGSVYRAEQPIGPYRREVAVKLLQPTLLQTAREEALARFLAEMGTLAKLEHEGIARIYDGGLYEDPATHDQLPYLAMELVRGGLPLTTYAKEYALAWPERLALMLRVCRAVQYAHEHRVVHRDLKPANILVDPEGRPVVIDFGLACVYDALLPGAHLAASGTPAYMSPEQISDRFGAISAKSDVYALGLILYELLAEQLPYTLPHGGAVEEWGQVIVEATPLPLSQHDKVYGGELEAIVAAALAKQPADRLSVAVLRSRLARALQQLPPAIDLPKKLTSPQDTRDQQQKHLFDIVKSNVAGRLLRLLHHAGLMTRPTEPPPPQAAVPGKPTPQRRGLTCAVGKKRLVLGAGLLLCLAGATATVFLRKPPLPVTTTSPPRLAPMISSPAAAYQALMQGNWTQAEGLLHRLVQQAEPRVQSQGYAGLAAVAFARSDAQQALGFATQAEALDPEVAYSHVIRGHLLWSQGKLGAAKIAYRLATEKSNALPWQQAIAANRLGRLYATEGFPGTALQYYDRAINVFPQMAPVYVNKAHLLEQVGRRPEAVELYRQAVQLDPEDRLAATLLRQAERQQQRALDRQQQASLAQRVVALLRAHEAGRPPESTGDDWTSAPLTLAFLGVQRLGPPAPQAGGEEFLFYSTAQALQDSGRILLIDQALLETLLGELQRSPADLADPQVALHMGSILAARLIATGSIVCSGTDETLSVSFIETATGAVRARADVTWTPGTFDGRVEPLARALLHQVRQAYPVRGRIAQVGPQSVLLNIGADQGVTPGLIMQVVGGAAPGAMGSPVGRIEVTAAEAQHSQARVLEHTDALQQGWTVQEVQKP